MKTLFVILLLVSTSSYAQLTMEAARNAASKYQLGSYSYHEEFAGYSGYGAPIILTADGGTAFFGDYSDKDGSGGMLVKLDKNGKEQWKKIVRPQFDELESQSVVQDKNGNFYVFMITYDYKKYRGGPERIVYFSKTGAVLWDKTIGEYSAINSPHVSYIRALPDGRVALRGHIANEKPAEGKDPVYRFWEGWISKDGKLTQQAGEIIDWGKQDWKKRYKPE